jgi:hypothetical protein
MGSIALQPLVNTANSSSAYATTYPNSVPYAPNSYWTIAPNLQGGAPAAGSDGIVANAPTLLGMSNAYNYGLASGVATLQPGNPYVALASGAGGLNYGGVGTLGYRFYDHNGPNLDGVGTLS